MDDTSRRPPSRLPHVVLRRARELERGGSAGRGLVSGFLGGFRRGGTQHGGESCPVAVGTKPYRTRVCVASRNEAVDRRRQLPRTNAVFVPRVGWYNYYQSFYAALQEEVDPHTRELASKLPEEHCDSDTEVGSPVCVYMKSRAAALAGVPELQYTLAPIADGLRVHFVVCGCSFIE